MIAGPVRISTTSGQIEAILGTWPDTCPNCGKLWDPNFAGGTLTQDSTFLYAAYTCPQPNCMGWAIAVYLHERGPRGESQYKLIQTYPTFLNTPDWPKVIDDLSPDFIAIYSDAYASEQYGLHRISGPGYGKALEFLVKDYAIKKNPGDAEQIKKKWLGDCIKSYIDDPRAKKMAERAAWLRNDETHYSREFTDLDLQDLKTLMRLVVNWIESELLSDEYEQAMPKSKKP